VSLAVVQHLRGVLGGVVHVVDAALQRPAVEVVVLGVGAAVLVGDQRERRALQRGAGQIAVRGVGVADDDRALGQHRLANLGGRLDQVPGEGLDGVVVGQRRSGVGPGLVVERVGEALFDRVALLVVEDREILGLDLQLAAAFAHFAVEANELALLDVGVRADAGFDERGAVDGAGLVV